MLCFYFGFSKITRSLEETIIKWKEAEQKENRTKKEWKGLLAMAKIKWSDTMSINNAGIAAELLGYSRRVAKSYYSR